MVIRADQVHNSDQVRLAGEWLKVMSFGIVKWPSLAPNSKYTHVKIWFSDETSVTLLRDEQISVVRGNDEREVTR